MSLAATASALDFTQKRHRIGTTTHTLSSIDGALRKVLESASQFTTSLATLNELLTSLATLREDFPSKSTATKEIENIYHSCPPSPTTSDGSSANNNLSTPQSQLQNGSAFSSRGHNSLGNGIRTSATSGQRDFVDDMQSVSEQLKRIARKDPMKQLRDAFDVRGKAPIAKLQAKVEYVESSASIWSTEISALEAAHAALQKQEDKVLGKNKSKDHATKQAALKKNATYLKLLAEKDAAEKRFARVKYDFNDGFDRLADSTAKTARHMTDCVLGESWRYMREVMRALEVVWLCLPNGRGMVRSERRRGSRSVESSNINRISTTSPPLGNRRRSSVAYADPNGGLNFSRSNSLGATAAAATRSPHTPNHLVPTSALLSPSNGYASVNFMSVDAVLGVPIDFAVVGQPPVRTTSPDRLSRTTTVASVNVPIPRQDARVRASYSSGPVANGNRRPNDNFHPPRSSSPNTRRVPPPTSPYTTASYSRASTNVPISQFASGNRK